MLGFLKKIFGMPTEAEVAAAKAVPYKVEPPVVNNKTGDVVVMPEQVASSPSAVNDQITDAVTQEAPAKKPRKPRTPKAETAVKVKTTKEKTAKAKKPAAISTGRRSKKA
jgi:hypothetical protein